MPKPHPVKSRDQRKKESPTELLSLISLLLVALTFWLYWPVSSHAFINYDDPDYITENPSLQDGLTWQSVGWAFGTGYAGNWHPVTWLSHLMDVELFGLNPAGHHLVSVVIHAVNTMLLFLVLRRLTGALWRSVIVSALFAMHPLRVESIAWVAERKDVLSGLFFLLTLLGYARYVALAPESASRIRLYVMTLVTYAAGLMAKPMLVTLPFVLLLLDYWPLRRMKLKRGTPLTADASTGIFTLNRLVWEKLPFFVLAAISSTITYLVQKGSGSVMHLETLSLGGRFANAVVAYFAYFKKMCWPTDLAVFYPHPLRWPLAEILVASVALGLITFLCYRLRRRNPALLTGWLWFGGMMIPVVGLVQVGSQFMADRYTYLPTIGLCIAFVWGMHQAFGITQWGEKLAPVAATAILFACAAATRHQLQFWQNSLVLFEHVLRVTPNSFFSYVAYTNVGFFLSEAGRHDEAVPYLLEAVKLNPKCGKAWNNLGTIAERKGNLTEARTYYERAVEFCPEDAQPLNNLASVLTQTGDVEGGLRAGFAALQLRPKLPQAHYNVANLMVLKTNLADAVQHYRQAVQIKTNYPEAHYNLGVCLTKLGYRAEAAHHFTETLRYNPQFQPARQQLDLLRATQPTD